MRINIAHDARPQVRTLLFAAALTVFLWFIPFAELLTYPFRIFVTFIHEGGHALAAILTGNSVHSLSVAMNGSGEVYSTTGGLFSQMFVSSAGYLGAMAFGALLLVLIRRTIAARFVLVGSAALILALTVAYGFSARSGTLAAEFVHAWRWRRAARLAIGAAIRPPRAAAFLGSFLAVQCV